MAYTVRGNRGAAIAATGSGTHTIVAETTGKKIVIQKLFLTSTTQCTVTILDSAGTTIAGPIPVASYGGFVLAADGEEWGHTAAGYALQISLSAAATVGGYVGYYTE